MDGGDLTAVSPQDLFQNNVAWIEIRSKISTHELDDFAAAAFQKNFGGYASALSMVRMNQRNILKCIEKTEAIYQ